LSRTPSNEEKRISRFRGEREKKVDKMQEDCIHLRKVALTFKDYECNLNVDESIFCDRKICPFYRKKEGESNDNKREGG
jgi:hypothetical protein